VKTDKNVRTLFWVSKYQMESACFKPRGSFRITELNNQPTYISDQTRPDQTNQSTLRYNSPASANAPGILWKPKLHNNVHESPPTASIWSQINPVHAFSTYLRSLSVWYYNRCLAFPNPFFTLGPPPPSSLMRNTDLAHNISIDLILKLHN
jgi:hypothetical protein